MKAILNLIFNLINLFINFKNIYNEGITYNHYTVFETTDKKILKHFNQPMKVVMNNAVTDKFNDDDYIKYKEQGRPFTITNFIYKEYAK